MKAIEVFTQNNGDITKAYYAELEALGPLGHIAVCLFRAQKRSSRAKDYSRGKYRRAAYDVKAWSMGELCAALSKPGSPITSWGWKQDTAVVFGQEPSWVLYVDLPNGIGQCSFHSPTRMAGPDYPGEWDGAHRSAERIIAFCDQVQSTATPLTPAESSATL
jgi:hypothetical protein